MHGHRIGIITLSVLLLAAWLPALAAVETRKLQVLLSANETKGEDDTTWTYAWSLDGKWFKPDDRFGTELTVDSDYSKSDDSEVDRLRTAFRFIDPHYGKELNKWYPVFLLQTEGDHTLDSVHTLGAFGYRQKQKYGFIELTAGASKDIRTAESWVGDVGLAFAYERKIGDKWKVSTGPKAEYGAIGQVRLRDDRLRYSWDVNVDYKMNDKVGLGYRLWYGNTVPNSERTQWLGVTYKIK